MRVRPGWTVDRQRIFEGYCGALVSMIQTSKGHIVVPVQPMRHDPMRNTLRSYVSEDDGKTWKPSNIIDLGGNHDHDGAMEPTLVELRDGRLWMLIRTTLGRFWEAYSDDYGYSWRVLRPSRIRAPSSPGYMIRLASGRLVLAYNHRYDLAYPYCRRELAISFSEDEGNTWTEPSLIARSKAPPGSYVRPLAYPYLFEARPGEIWVATWCDGLGLCVSVKEADFVVGP